MAPRVARSCRGAHRDPDRLASLSSRKTCGIEHSVGSYRTLLQGPHRRPVGRSASALRSPSAATRPPLTMSKRPNRSVLHHTPPVANCKLEAVASEHRRPNGGPRPLALTRMLDPTPAPRHLWAEKDPSSLCFAGFSSPKTQWSARVVRDLPSRRAGSVGNDGRFPRMRGRGDSLASPYIAAGSTSRERPGGRAKRVRAARRAQACSRTLRVSGSIGGVPHCTPCFREDALLRADRSRRRTARRRRRLRCWRAAGRSPTARSSPALVFGRASSVRARAWLPVAGSGGELLVGGRVVLGRGHVGRDRLGGARRTDDRLPHGAEAISESKAADMVLMEPGC